MDELQEYTVTMKVRGPSREAVEDWLFSYLQDDADARCEYMCIIVEDA